MKHAATTNLWFGTEESFQAYEAAATQLSALMAQGEDALKTAIRMFGGGDGEDPFGMPSLVKVVDGVAQIDVSGSLVNGSSGFMRLFGVLGYSDITGALGQVAAMHAAGEVKSGVLMIDSGGGAVNGVQDAGQMIQAIGAKMPLVAYTDGSMFSAAYWLGASANEVIASNTSQVGSVGTLIVHMDATKALEMSGRKATLIRHGEFKAIANPFEPLSADAKAQLQSLADGSGKIFVNYVAGRRGMTASDFQATAGEGRVFLGDPAKKVGLVDAVMGYNDLMTKMKKLDTSNSRAHNSRAKGNSSMKAHLSKKSLLAIATGVALDALGLSAVEANAEGITLEAADLAALTVEAQELITARDAALAVAKAAASTEAKAEIEPLLTKAQADLKAATDKVALLEAGTAGLTGQVAAANEMAATSAGIVRASLGVMQVALGGSGEIASTLVGKELLAEHEKVKEQFTKKFPVNGVAAVNLPIKKPDAAKSGPSPEFLARLGKTDVK